MQIFFLLLLFLPLCICSNSEVKYKKYESNWDSLDTRPLPEWFDKAKFGIFIHWGVFSVPSFGSEWFWNFWITQNYSGYVNFMKKNYPPNFSYQDFAKDFTAEFYDPEYWAEVFQNSGAKYIVLTSKHHEGYTLWPSKTAFGWNAVDVGPHRDILGELANAIRSKTDLRFGLYHSLFEWYNPLYLQDKHNNYTTQYFVLQKTLPELYELVEEYQPDIIWSDGSIESTYEYWKATDFIAWLYNESPNKETIIVNDRWGKGMNGKHGDFYTYTDRYNPGVLLPHKWENCDTIDKLSFGYRRNTKLSDYRTTEELIAMLAKTVSCGGNLLLNIAPTKEGIITPIYEERLRSMGSWLKVNAEAIYESKPWLYQNDTQNPHVWYTSKDKNVYAIVLEWPTNRVLSLGAPETTDESTVILLGYPHPLNWSRGTNATLVQFPSKADVSTEWSWVLKITNLANRL